ncbi:protein mono-ADP-ribosyltransferase PARP12-like [Cylas formicarius]|uniref:protein mono-ADP-ribosyltransferase PARP12-like n=1 Tax=Cylas formicarius TaxID=197179 RepID=UPI0029587F39|nr:protein mono-ADP-ribosyltransferase PARP12-like [Cylas formicarius]
MSVEDLRHLFAEFHLNSEQTRLRPEPLKVTTFVDELLMSFGKKRFLLDSMVFGHCQLEQTSDEYASCRDKFLSSMRVPRVIIKIDKIFNAFLLAHYKLKTAQKVEDYGRVSIKDLFHGTACKNLLSICENNFNWRLNGRSVGHKFGQGISFAKRSTYASHYPRNSKDCPRIMFLARVAVSKECLGHQGMIVPSEGCDTSIKIDGDVIVKYEDAECYPKYVIFYK